jgi:hypothetical protein
LGSVLVIIVPMLVNEPFNPAKERAMRAPSMEVRSSAMVHLIIARVFILAALWPTGGQRANT